MDEHVAGTTGEQLELASLVALVRSAREKQQQAKALTKREIAAIKKLERINGRKAALEFMRSMPKGDYLELCGGSNKVYIDWRERHGFPWPPHQHQVDVLVIHEWYRHYVAGGGETRTASDPTLLRGAEKKDFYEGERAELKYLESSGQLVDVELFFRDQLDPFCDQLRSAIELVGRISPDAQRVMLDGLERAEETIRNAAAPVASERAAGRGRAARRPRAAKAAAHTPRVRGKVHHDAA